nr:HAMP domain-containing sensor histidine kinase [Alkalibaculum sporogenes]
MFSKVFLCTLFILTLSLGVAGYYLISTSFNASLQRETDRALEQYQLIKFNLQSSILGANDKVRLSDETLTTLSQQTVEFAPEETLVGIYDGDTQSLISSDTDVPWTFEDIKHISQNQVHYQLLLTEDDNNFLVAVGAFTQSDQEVILCIARNINGVFFERSNLIRSYQTIYGIVLLISTVIMLGLFAILMYPIKKLTQATVRIAEGNYFERVKVTNRDEIGVLGVGFNRMAATIEAKIDELERNAHQKEDFVANFAHELKTPLTSVIGYADMIYQKDLSKNQLREAATYIISEGTHLEALSFKLLELTVLGRKDFVLEQFIADELLEDIKKSIAPLMEKKKMQLEFIAQTAYVYVEYDLIKTMLLNLIDNGVKAESTQIRILGEFKDDLYTITVADDGKGIPENELYRITEAFYTVDKSRSRQQHSVGLGLSIAARIAKIHGTQLQYTSKLGLGTEVSFVLSAKEVEHGES